MELTPAAPVIPKIVVFLIADPATSHKITSSVVAGVVFRVNPSIVKSVALADPLVRFPLIVLAAICAALAFVIALFATVNAPAALSVASPDNVLARGSAPV